jgi:hypothetical protein
VSARAAGIPASVVTTTLARHPASNATVVAAIRRQGDRSRRPAPPEGRIAAFAG